MAIGQALTAPEAGWKRYDTSSFGGAETIFKNSKDGMFYFGGDWLFAGVGDRYGATRAKTNIADSYVTFKFQGTKLRLITSSEYGATSMATVTIDGVSEECNFSLPSKTLMWLAYEKELPSGIHEVTVTKSNDSVYFELDAIDIDSTGRLLHPDEVLTPSDLTIGKRIRCHYTAPISGQVGTFSGLGQGTSDFIPVTSSATPDGDFYLIYVDDDYKGRKKLIADRNIQHSISWNTLNTAGIATGSGINVEFQSTPILSADDGNVIYSDQWSTAEAWKVFNNVASYGASPYGGWASANSYGWVGYDFKVNKRITSYEIQDNVTYPNASPKDWTFEGWDGVSWVILDTQINVTWTAGQKRKFNISNPSNYTKYRINVTAQGGFNGTVDLIIGELVMYEDLSEFSFTTRLLTGGVSALDIDNEWDKYIINSDLGGTIIAGDNAVWNWSGYASWTSTTTTSSGSRAYRGNTTGSTWASTISSSTGATATGFRPVLIIESLSTIKYLLQDGTNIKKLDLNNIWQILGITPVTEDMFKENGMDDLSPVTQVITSGFIDMTNDGTVGEGRQFSANLVDGMISVIEVVTS